MQRVFRCEENREIVDQIQSGNGDHSRRNTIFPALYKVIRAIQGKYDMSKVSVIMPVYNAEKYLGEAIASVLRQTYADFELLLVNDRSTDRSKEICMEYAKKDDRIVLLENDSELHGPGPTRNIGLDHATGEFIYFMDADDWIEDRLLEDAVHCMQETGADMVQFGVFYERMDGRNQQYFWSGKNLLTKNEIKNNFSCFWKENRNTLWLYLFRTDAVQAIRFEDMISGEDICYVMDALSNAETIAYIAKAFYHYRYVEGSTSHRWNEETIECRGIIWDHQKKFLDSLPGDLNPLAYAEVAFDNYIWAIYQLCAKGCPLSFTEKRKELSNLAEKMSLDSYRPIYPLKLRSGLHKIKYALVKFHLENALLLLGPVFLRIVRGE